MSPLLRAFCCLRCGMVVSLPIMESLVQKVTADENIRKIGSLAAELHIKAYLVGGGIRDILLGREAKDLDFALDAGFEELPRRFAQEIGGSFFWLDEERRQARVVQKGGELGIIFDFAPLRGATIIEDLLARDFTINAIAIPIGSVTTEIIDPLDGRGDLANRLIRACTERTFTDDPLRLLRAFRFAASLGFAIEDSTRRWMGGKENLLERVAVERIRDEIMQTLAVPVSAPSLAGLHQEGLLPVVLSFPDEKGSEEFNRRLVALAAFERLYGGLEILFDGDAEWVRTALAVEVEGGISLLALAKLAAFLGRDDGAETVPALTKNLRLGRRATRVLGLLLPRLFPVLGIIEQKPTGRAMYRFFRDREPAGLAVLLLALARDDLPLPFCRDLLRYLRDEYDPVAKEFLLSGDEVMELLGIGQGPEVGMVRELLRVAESTGTVSTREEARSFIKNQLTKPGRIG